MVLIVIIGSISLAVGFNQYHIGGGLANVVLNWLNDRQVDEKTAPSIERQNLKICTTEIKYNNQILVFRILSIPFKKICLPPL